MTGQWIIAHNERPIPANRHRNLHYQAAATYNRGWRQAFNVLARQRKVPALQVIEITVQQIQAKGTLPDTMASAPTVKAAIDGLVDAGVIPDDTGKHLAAVTFLPPVKGNGDWLTLTIEAVE